MITLKNVFTCAGPDSDCLGYTADVHWKSKKIGSARNDGHGRGSALALTASEATVLEAERFAKSLPFKGSDGTVLVVNDEAVGQSLIDAIDSLAMHHDKLKRAKRTLISLLKVRTMFVHDNEVMEVAESYGKGLEASLAKQFPGSIFLNKLSLDAATDLYVAALGGSGVGAPSPSRLAA